MKKTHTGALLQTELEQTKKETEQLTHKTVFATALLCICKGDKNAADDLLGVPSTQSKDKN